jgi:hypothetical protein
MEEASREPRIVVLSVFVDAPNVASELVEG